MINIDDLSIRFGIAIFLMANFVLLMAIFFGKFPTKISSKNSRAVSR